jgi:hypothetical protein
LIRDIGREIEGRQNIEVAFALPLVRASRIRRQRGCPQQHIQKAPILLRGPRLLLLPPGTRAPDAPNTSQLMTDLQNQS